MADNEHWSKRSQPRLVSARHPHKDGVYMTLAAHPDTWRQIWKHDALSRSLMGQFAGLVHGSYVESETDALPALARPTAIFRGIKREVGPYKNGYDKNIYAYVTNPPCDYSWPRPTSGVPVRIPKPIESVFVTFVDLNPTAVEAAGLPDDHPSYKSTMIDGIITWWAWSLASENDSFLPFDHRERYEEQVL